LPLLEKEEEKEGEWSNKAIEDGGSGGGSGGA
jgi:hypothetical protein